MNPVPSRGLPLPFDVWLSSRSYTLRKPDRGVHPSSGVVYRKLKSNTYQESLASSQLSTAMQWPTPPGSLVGRFLSLGCPLLYHLSQQRCCSSKVAGPPRFERGLTESKSVVLPLHHGPSCSTLAGTPRSKDKHQPETCQPSQDRVGNTQIKQGV